MVLFALILNIKETIHSTKYNTVLQWGASAIFDFFWLMLRD